MTILLCHIISFAAGFILDLILGDPHNWPHPIRLIGSLIGGLEKKLNQGNDRQRKTKGLFMVLITLITTLLSTVLILCGAYYINIYAGIVVESIMTYQILATKSLKKESMKVYHALKNQGIDEARQAVSMIVGRDTEALDQTGVAKAAVETIAENASDGVIAPMIYLAVGGPILGFFYKAVNTMDSMVGYKNDRYLYFGRYAAKLDDLANFLPARISALLMILAAYLGGRDFDGKAAWKIFKRDRYNHKSPNSAQTESVCAGALHIRLAGSAYYFGKLVEKPYIGDDIRGVEYEDIKRANKLMYITAILCQLICLGIMVSIFFIR